MLKQSKNGNSNSLSLLREIIRTTFGNDRGQHLLLLVILKVSTLFLFIHYTDILVFSLKNIYS